MKLEELCAAVQEARYYNERFTRREYTSAFRTYTERFGAPSDRNCRAVPE